MFQKHLLYVANVLKECLGRTLYPMDVLNTSPETSYKSKDVFLMYILLHECLLKTCFNNFDTLWVFIKRILYLMDVLNTSQKTKRCLSDDKLFYFMNVFWKRVLTSLIRYGCLKIVFCTL